MTNSAPATELIWDLSLPALPPGKDQSKQIGLAGAFSGILQQQAQSGHKEEIIVVAGGANFSKQALLTTINKDENTNKNLS